jgi:drug/metabolite transporter (DMT)-like permease
MSSIALPLILLSAVMHASWNLIAKRAKTTGVALVWLFAVFETLLFLPLVIILLNNLRLGTVPWLGVGFMVGAGFMHTLYFWLLSAGYRVGDLSVVYPIARGTGPLLSTIGAVLLFAERPTLIVFSGTVMICVGVIILTGDPRNLLKSSALAGVTYGLLTGLVVAVYTLWDAYAMKNIVLTQPLTMFPFTLTLPDNNEIVSQTVVPLLYQAGLSFSRMLILLPAITMRRDALSLAWEHDKWKAAGIAVLSSLAYVLILFVLVFTPVNYVAPMRTVSILIGVLIGTNLLKEQDMRRRVIAAIAIIVGVVLLNIG